MKLSAQSYACLSPHTRLYVVVVAEAQECCYHVVILVFAMLNRLGFGSRVLKEYLNNSSVTDSSQRMVLQVCGLHLGLTAPGYKNQLVI
jgi:hypothetical protein